MPSSPPALNLSQHHGLFQWVSSSHQVAKLLENQLQYFQWIFRVNFLQDWLVWSSCRPRNSQESSPAPQFKSINSSVFTLLYGPTLTSVHESWKKPYLWLYRPLLAIFNILLSNILSRFIIAFLPWSKCLLILWLQSPSTVILEPKKIISVTVCTFFFYLPWHDGTGCHDLSFFFFWMLSFKPAFSLSSLTFIKRLFYSSLSTIKVVSSAYLRLLIFLLAT